MRETEERWQATSADLDRERVQHESARLASTTLESMLGFKDDLLQSLMACEVNGRQGVRRASGRGQGWTAMRPVGWVGDFVLILFQIMLGLVELRLGSL